MISVGCFDFPDLDIGMGDGQARHRMDQPDLDGHGLRPPDRRHRKRGRPGKRAAAGKAKELAHQ